MTSLRSEDVDSPIDTRQRLLDVAMVLIGQHGCASTSLQMIADELGITKAAIYHHFRTRDELLLALMGPILRLNRRVVEEAERQNTPRRQMDAMVRGYAEVVARNRSLAAVLVFDVSLRRILQSRPEWGDVIERQLALLMQLEPDSSGFLKTTALFSGLAGAATGAPLDIDEDMLIDELTAIGRRLLGLPQRKRAGDGDPAQDESRRPEPLARRWKDILAEA